MDQENFIYSKKVKQNSWIYIFFLVISFIWLSVYPTMSALMSSLEIGFGDAFAEKNIGTIVSNIVVEAFLSWIVFEILFWIYRYVLSFKIYSFVVPMDSFKAETRLYFIFRNIILGIIYNLCFIYPFLYIYNSFFNLLITLVVLICYSKHLNSTYSDSIIGHFVFKNFCYPIFIYEAIEILCSIWLVML